MTTILKIPRMSQEFLDRLAGRIVRREVWITNTPQSLYQTFGLILMATLDGLSHDVESQKFCSYCGKSLGNVPVCSGCDKSLGDAEAVYCTYCGAGKGLRPLS